MFSRGAVEAAEKKKGNHKGHEEDTKVTKKSWRALRARFINRPHLQSNFTLRRRPQTSEREYKLRDLCVSFVSFVVPLLFGFPQNYNPAFAARDFSECSGRAP